MNPVVAAAAAVMMSMLFGSGHTQSGREAPRIAAEYAVYPQAITVSERVLQSSRLEAIPRIQSTGLESAYQQSGRSHHRKRHWLHRLSTSARPGFPTASGALENTGRHSGTDPLHCAA